MRFLADAGISPKTVAFLIGLGHDAVHVRTIGLERQLKPYLVVERDPAASRGKTVRLAARGLEAQRDYFRLTAEIETRWQRRFGKEHVRRLRDALQALLGAEKGERVLLSEGLVPPSGTVRSGDIGPALGRHDIGAAAKRRARDLVSQTAAFVRDPAGTLPHYPLWDMNRGFGP